MRVSVLLVLAINLMFIHARDTNIVSFNHLGGDSRCAWLLRRGPRMQLRGGAEEVDAVGEDVDSHQCNTLPGSAASSPAIVVPDHAKQRMSVCSSVREPGLSARVAPTRK
eukprot:3501095-Rhodomonas_salina.1